MISISDYLGPWSEHEDATPERRANAEAMLEKVNELLDEAANDGVPLPRNPITGTQVSGETLGGFRPQDAKQGKADSSHKQGRGVDVYDPQNKLDAWLTDEILERFGLYREDPSATRRWCHLTDRAPGSGRRTFMP